MAILTDLFNAAGSQLATPQQTIIPTDQLLSQAYNQATGLAPQVIAYNQALAPGLTNVQLGVEKLYDPNIATLRAATSKSILDELNLGTSLPQDLQERVVRDALEKTAASGFGVGQGGRGLVAADLGLTGLDLASRRRAEASGAVRSSPSLSSLYQPDRGIGPDAVASDIRNVQAARDEYTNLVEDTRRKNFSSLLNTGTRIAGMIGGGFAGAALGNPVGGVMAGGAIGSQVFGGGVAGVGGIGGPQNGIGATGPFSLLSSLFGGGSKGAYADQVAAQQRLQTPGRAVPALAL